MRRRSGFPTKRYVQRSYNRGATSLIFGTVLAEGKVYERGAVVFDAQGTITCVGCGCVAEGQAKIDCGEHIVSPGLINAHDHIGWIHQPPAQWGEERFEHRHDWRKGKRGHSRISSGSSGGADQRRGESFDNL